MNSIQTENLILLDRIKSNKAVLWLAVITVFFLAPNTYYVYYGFCVFISPYRELASAGVSFIVAASVLLYTLRKNYRVARYYSVFEMLISAYYYVTTIGWDWGLLPALGFTLILPVSIYFFSKEIENVNNLPSLIKRIVDKSAQSEIDLLKKINDQDHINDRQKVNELIEELKQKKEEREKINPATRPKRIPMPSGSDYPDVIIKEQKERITIPSMVTMLPVEAKKPQARKRKVKNTE